METGIQKGNQSLRIQPGVRLNFIHGNTYRKLHQVGWVLDTCPTPFGKLEVGFAVWTTFETAFRILHWDQRTSLPVCPTYMIPVHTPFRPESRCHGSWEPY